jgi:hypothetical protein
VVDSESPSRPENVRMKAHLFVKFRMRRLLYGGPMAV